MAKKRTMTLNLSEQEMLFLDRLATQKGVSKTVLVRQSLRLYQSITERLDRGEKLFIENQEKDEKAELMVL